MIRLKYNRHSQNEEVEHLDIKDFKIIPHPEFDPVSLQNDIALIKLDIALSYEYYKIAPVCLPLDKEEENIHGLVAIGRKSKNSKRRSRLSVSQVNTKECAKIINELSDQVDNKNKSSSVIQHFNENQLCIFKDGKKSEIFESKFFKQIILIFFFNFFAAIDSNCKGNFLK